MTGLLRRASCNAIRGLLQDGAVVPALRTLCAPFRASASLDLANLAAPVVFVANHASHLDAPAILAALPRSIRHRTAFAAAEDYFYRNRLLGFAVGLAIGAFPFPRHGSQGVERAAALLADGWNVVLFPEGTRSADGAQQLFRDGVGRLLLASHTAAVPLAIEGTRAVWPRSRRLPRFSPGHGSIAVRLGRPWRPWPDATPREISAELWRQVAALSEENLPHGRCDDGPLQPGREHATASARRMGNVLERVSILPASGGANERARASAHDPC